MHFIYFFLISKIICRCRKPYNPLKHPTTPCPPKEFYPPQVLWRPKIFYPGPPYPPRPSSPPVPPCPPRPPYPPRPPRPLLLVPFTVSDKHYPGCPITKGRLTLFPRNTR